MEYGFVSTKNHRLPEGTWTQLQTRKLPVDYSLQVLYRPVASLGSRRYRRYRQHDGDVDTETVKRYVQNKLLTDV